MKQMNENVIGAIAIIVCFLFLFYVNKWDLVDMTGLAKKSAVQGMPSLAESMSMTLEPGRTEIRQGELFRKTKHYELTVLPDLNRISVTFNQQLGIYLLDKKDPRKANRPKNLNTVDFTALALNKTFLEHLATNEKSAERLTANPDVEQSLITFFDSWGGRKLSSFSLRNDTLHVVFEYRGYLPLSLIQNATPLIINFADAITKKTPKKTDISSETQ